jgi:hypothetical protein
MREEPAFTLPALYCYGPIDRRDRPAYSEGYAWVAGGSENVRGVRGGHGRSSNGIDRERGFRLNASVRPEATPERESDRSARPPGRGGGE